MPRPVRAIVDAYVRSTLECGGSTPLWHNAEEENQGGVEPPHSKVLRTAIFTRAAVSDTAAKDPGKSTARSQKMWKLHAHGLRRGLQDCTAVQNNRFSIVDAL